MRNVVGELYITAYTTQKSVRPNRKQTHVLLRAYCVGKFSPLTRVYSNDSKHDTGRQNARQSLQLVEQ